MRHLHTARAIVARLHHEGHEAYIVGGWVRDYLLKRPSKDIDIGTSATPDEVTALFPQHVPIGRKFGVLTVSVDGESFEISTFRTEQGYGDRRRPDAIRWANASDDVKRRDLTINGLLFDPITNQVIDVVNGQRDLAQRRIRTIGEPSERFGEDPLRLLRAIRLRNQLQFQYDSATWEALTQLSGELRHVSSERVAVELNLMLNGPWRVQAIQDLRASGALAVLLPELDRLIGVPQPREYHQEGDVFDHTLRSVSTLAPAVPLFLVWGVLLHDCGKPQTLAMHQVKTHQVITTYHHAEASAQIATAVLRRLKFPQTEVRTVEWLIRHHMSLKGIEAMRPAKRERYVLDPRFPWLLELHRADASGTIPKDLSLYHHDLLLHERLRAYRAQASQVTPRTLIDGDGLQTALHLRPGPLIGQLLEQIRSAQLDGSIHTQSEAVAFAQTVISSLPSLPNTS
ncbi:CCA tRNA nucleotidyltransferase [Candidatus Berkelbacteria bacterium]|nr:CCA tRNA nucleotidyltransferase [Candidatus Berkelbacteria bacterium]